MFGARDVATHGIAPSMIYEGRTVAFYATVARIQYFFPAKITKKYFCLHFIVDQRMLMAKMLNLHLYFMHKQYLIFLGKKKKKKGLYRTRLGGTLNPNLYIPLHRISLYLRWRRNPDSTHKVLASSNRFNVANNLRC